MEWSQSAAAESRQLDFGPTQPPRPAGPHPSQQQVCAPVDLGPARMGIHGLWQLVEPVKRPILLETLAGRRLAIDASIWMYQFQMAMRDKKTGDPLQGSHISPSLSAHPGARAVADRGGAQWARFAGLSSCCTTALSLSSCSMETRPCSRSAPSSVASFGRAREIAADPAGTTRRNASGGRPVRPGTSQRPPSSSFRPSSAPAPRQTRSKSASSGRAQTYGRT